MTVSQLLSASLSCHETELSDIYSEIGPALLVIIFVLRHNPNPDLFQQASDETMRPEAAIPTDYLVFILLSFFRSLFLAAIAFRLRFTLGFS